MSMVLELNSEGFLVLEDGTLCWGEAFGALGPARDNEYLFDYFLEMVGEARRVVQS